MARPYLASVTEQPLARRQFDVLVLGGGIAGLAAAVAAARRWHVGLLTKSTLDDTTTFLAQGGIAAALGPSDSPELHFQDTVNAGAVRTVRSSSAARAPTPCRVSCTRAATPPAA
jgi:L-aspartate oxidase